jgi:hypothetical protein
VEVVDMTSPYLTQVLAAAHTDELLRAACRTGGVRRRPGRPSRARLRDWLLGQLHRPEVARTAVLPGRPGAPVACSGR